jgi:hypothetical protein
MGDPGLSTKQTTHKAPPTAPLNEKEDSPSAQQSGGIAFPILMHGWFEKSTDQARENLATMRSAAEKVSSDLQDTCSATLKESLNCAATLIDHAHANTAAALDLATAILSAKTRSEALEFSAEHGRRQMETMLAQYRQLWAAAHKVSAAMMLNTRPGQSK